MVPVVPVHPVKWDTSLYPIRPGYSLRYQFPNNRSGHRSDPQPPERKPANISPFHRHPPIDRDTGGVRIPDRWLRLPRDSSLYFSANRQHTAEVAIGRSNSITPGKLTGGLFNLRPGNLLADPVNIH